VDILKEFPEILTEIFPNNFRIIYKAEEKRKDNSILFPFRIT
jgi:hypothetical protein